MFPFFRMHEVLVNLHFSNFQFKTFFSFEFEEYIQIQFFVLGLDDLQDFFFDGQLFSDVTKSCQNASVCRLTVRPFFFSFEQRKAEPFVRHNCFVAIPPVCCRSRQHRHYRSRTPVRQPFLALASLGSPAGRLAGQPAPLRYGAIALCSQVDSRLSGSGGTIITRYTKSLPGSILHSRQRSQNFALLAWLLTMY